MDMEQRDYDSRTALHVAAAEGKTSQMAFIALKPRPWPSVTTLSSESPIASYSWCLCCLQDTWGPCASSWMLAEWTRYPKTGEPTFTGTCKWSERGLQRCCPGHRWGNTPLDEAMHFCHHDVVDILRQRQDTCSPPAADDTQQPGGKSRGTFFWQQNDHQRSRMYYSTCDICAIIGLSLIVHIFYIFRNRGIVSYHDIHHFITLWQIKPDVKMFMKY